MRYQRRHDYELILERFQALGTQTAVAKELGIHQSSVSKVLIHYGIRLGRGNRPPVHELPMDEVISRYLAGESTGQLGEAFGVDPEVIRRRLRSKRVARRRVGGPAGERNSQWKGGKDPTMHYYRRQSYEVAAICLGRPLPAGWIIHHIDENPHNNDWRNLVLFRCQADHAKFHQQLLRLQRGGQPVDATRLALGSGARALPGPPRPIVFALDTDPPDLWEKLA